MQLIQVLEAGEALLHAVAGSGRVDLHSVDNLAKLLCPCVKAPDSQLVKKFRLQILLHDVHLCHAVHDGGGGSKHDAAPAVELLQVSDLRVKVRCSQCFSAAVDAGDVCHSGRDVQVLEVVCFIDKQTVNAELFKLDVVLVLFDIRQLGNLGFKLFPLLLHILDRHGLLTGLSLCLIDRLNDFIYLLLIKLRCEGVGNRDFLELLIGDDNCVIVSGRNPVCKGLAVLCGKVVLACNKQLCSGEVV